MISFALIFPCIIFTIDINCIICLIMASSTHDADCEIYFNSIEIHMLRCEKLILYSNDGPNILRNETYLLFINKSIKHKYK